MDRYGTGGYSSPYGAGNVPLNLPGTGSMTQLSPYLNIDPGYLYQSEGPEFIFPEGASHKRGRFELAFSQIGGSVMTGAVLGGVNGLYIGARETAVAGQTGAIRRTQYVLFTIMSQILLL
ncbi:PREDICTED: mitochondrial import inner membrane translocase subunit Tim23-like [Priapulus caudatus]|uniref:Mitochondrial import inner membrane translocase subunit Tim23-like n=1 Tax=Priapulus caudatus TaxID=37621 RepID=A0ABM1DSS4_PRICU|nr:PREDICTED: mitochondrial import inner membrane translocase subunit Tim23-like [Priapulus caudatus]